MKKGVPADKVIHFANWVDTSAIHPLDRRSAMRAELDIDPAATVVLYAGNMGVKQGLECSRPPRLRWLNDGTWCLCFAAKARSGSR